MGSDNSLQSYIKVQGGFAFKSKDFKNEGIPVIKIKNVGFGHLKFDEYSCVDIEVANKAKDFLIKPGDVLISMTGSGPNNPDSLVGRVAKVKENDPKALINQRVGRLVLKEKCSLDLRYIYYLLSTKRAQTYLVSNSTGSANQANINGKTILSFSFPKVSYNESVKIADILETLDTKNDLNHQINQTLEQISQAIFQSWFIDFEPVKAKKHLRKLGGDSAQIERAAQAIISGAVNLEDIIAEASLTDLDNEIKSKLETKLGCQTKEQQCKLAETAKFFPDKLIESELGIIPEGWKSTALSEIIELKYGKALKKNDREKGAYPVYGSGGIVGSHDEYLVKGPGVIVARKGSVGNLFWTENNFFPIDTTFFVSPVIKVPLFWVYMKLRTIDILSLSSDSAVPGVNRNALLSQKIILPNLMLLEKFMNYITPFVQLKNANQNEIKSLSSLRDEFLPRLLSGKMDVSEK
jgi:type I restriction enzyme, S subunit